MSSTSQLASAELGLTSAQAGYDSKIVPATASTIATDKAGVTTAEDALRQANTTLGGATLTSPVDGVVDAVSIVAGAQAPSAAAVVIASSAMEVSASVTETDYPSLKLGQAVNVTMTATGQTATGTVTEIDPSGSSSGSGGVVSFPILVGLDSTPAGTAAGMSASISVTIQQAANVIAVPATALVGSGGQYEVRVLDSSGAVQLVPVTVGLVTTSLAEIQSGLSAGDTVVVGTSSPRTSTATTTTNAGSLTGGFGGFGGGAGGGTRNRTGGQP